jgi:cytochrome c oxidase subunit 1
MAYVAIADRDHEIEHHDPTTFITKYIWSQDHKVIAIQYSITAIFVGLIALGLSVMMRLQLGFPDSFSFITPINYYQFITMHGMIMVIFLLTALFLGGFGNYLIPLMIGSRDMVFPFMNMLSYWVYLVSVIILLASFFVPGGPTGAGWTLYPPQAILPGTPFTRLLHRRFHDGRPELCNDHSPGACTRNDHDAPAVVAVGHIHGHGPWPAGVSSPFCQRCDDDA